MLVRLTLVLPLSDLYGSFSWELLLLDTQYLSLNMIIVIIDYCHYYYYYVLSQAGGKNYYYTRGITWGRGLELVR